MTGQQLDTLKHGGRVLRAGDVVKVHGLRGTWTIRSFRVWDDQPERPAEVTLTSGCWRTVTIDRIGARKALAAKASAGKADK